MQIDSITSSSDGATSLTAIKADISDLDTRSTSSGIFNVKDYGALGDNSANDTDAINLAIADANTLVASKITSTLFFPAGWYKVTPGELDTIHCNIDASSAMLVSADNTDANLLTLGGGNCPGVDVFPIANIAGLIGSTATTDGTHYGSGIGFNGAVGTYPGQWTIRVGTISGFRLGLNLDTSPNFHIGTNQFNINNIWYCTTGIYFGANAAGGYQNENNRIFVNYLTHCPTSISMVSTALSSVIQNIIEIDCLEIHTLAGSNGITMAGANTYQNIFTVNSIFYGANTTYIVVTDGNPHDNQYNLPGVDLSKLSDGACIFNVGINSIGMLGTTSPGRSVVCGAAGGQTSFASVKVGDRYIVNNPAPGGVGQYCYTSGGWKAETTVAS
jgi:hypothetical protein